ncbi:MAG TPA: cytochrome c oxidase assembly protein [Streptosporangiaceae bacterium]|nr:cytochrome c oxidase assembly protein [Streptosporangiaceae bacterium]
MTDGLLEALIVAVFAWHLLGERHAGAPRRRPRPRPARQRELAFCAGLLIIAIALSPPVDALTDELFWAQMIQRLLLLTAAAPLIALGRPWISLWRPFPPGVRRPVTRAVTRSPSCAPIRGLFRVLARPPGAWLVFSITLVFWHLPGPNDLTLRNGYAHLLADGAFVVTGIFFWNQVTGSSRATSPAPYSRRIGYVASAMLTNVGLAIFLAFAPHPLYAPYADLTHRPGGLSALADQQIGAGVMWAAGDLPFAIALALLVQHWLAAHEAMTPRLDQLVAGAVERGWPATAGQPSAPSAQAAALPMEVTPATGPVTGRDAAQREGPP